ncbi:hypothetical protein PILCRDRAFT_167719 [Piloderma croceum F 1598]|uniref:Uncharacterized protein n=1 Tax=Piloderma croceum (strain F 1598) TaxID=765440 RepID=A0A0C3BXD7_PILCF|nr:hypothetical protein PILCRDRAFT_167719 [Piloderma croceum F 1598]
MRFASSANERECHGRQWEGKVDSRPSLRFVVKLVMGSHHNPRTGKASQTERQKVHQSRVKNLAPRTQGKSYRLKKAHLALFSHNTHLQLLQVN